MSRFLKNTVAVLVIFIALVAALECLYRLLKVPKITHHNIQAKGQDLIPQINSNSILILGDSKLEWGINPAVIKNKFPDGTNVIDMAMPGSNGSDIMRYLLQQGIYPKLIILGFASNYGGYKNHGFDKTAFTATKKITAGIEYFMDENLYFRDQSVMEYVKHGAPYFKSHQYDSQGGATVTEYGDYTKRSTGQVEMYRAFKKNFNQQELDKYCEETDSLIDAFKAKGTIVCGLYMPVSEKIYTIQHSQLHLKANNINYNRYYDFSKFTYTSEKPGPDSLFFLDGCHLLHDYSLIFSAKLADSIQKDFPALSKK